MYQSTALKSKSSTQEKKSRMRRAEAARAVPPIDPLYNKYSPIIARHLALGNKLGEAEKKETKEEVVSLYNKLKRIFWHLAERFQEHLNESNKYEFKAS